MTRAGRTAGTEVQRLDRVGGARTAMTGDGNLTVRQVVVATGCNCSPAEPSWPGQDGFPGKVIHAARYSTPEHYPGRDVLVVGSGNTGAEIAAVLAQDGAGLVWLSVRTPPDVAPRALVRRRSPCSRSRWRALRPGWPIRETGSFSGSSSAISPSTVCRRRPRNWWRRCAGLRLAGLTITLKGPAPPVDLDARAVARAVARELRSST